MWNIDWTDFNLATLGEDSNDIPESTVVNLKTSKVEISLKIKFNNQLKVALDGENGKWRAFVVPIDFTWNNQKGQGSAVFWYPTSDQEFDVHKNLNEIRQFVVEPEKSSDRRQRKLISPFMDKRAQIVSNSGGKGSSIAILKEIQATAENTLEFEVPDGFVIGVKAYNDHLQKNSQIVDLIKSLESVAYKRIDGNLENACQK